MTDEEKKKIIDQIKKQFPAAEEQRIESLLNLILLEIESYNTCGKKIDWKKLSDLVSEVLYQAMKNESEKTITAVKRGDTSISYANTSQAVRQLLDGYAAMVKRLIGCDNGVSFF
ncbi:hypothetical protein A5819_003135 [Enterococcus sp. 7E2_DIV0204]|uniref:hypothetical protein n=1 Tax=unclassified Enterococcus TaxID=2608891 RepID=UPI000A335301|nr:MULTISPECIES: hypothetical protein [unclassified Enterococcus]OTN86301.1 hypothetical protein A5819_003135 [Enterococcus sp. 7E2_DIV0204]OTP48506.1 hypothetical protein A5884_003169 [Enterococcus sp. 7D2_DIV0200]